MTPPTSTDSAWARAPVSPTSTALVFVASFVTFMGIILWTWGMSPADSGTVLPSATLWAHGLGACALVTPTSSSAAYPLSGPVFPLLDALFQWVLRLGHDVPFPAHLGARHCAQAYNGAFTWATKGPLAVKELDLGFVTWPVLALGALSLLRTSNRARTRDEWWLLLALAVSPGALFAFMDYYHPEDLLALGLALACAAALRREHFVVGGTLGALAFASQQNVVLILMVCTVLLPHGRAWWRVGLGGTLTLVALVVPLTLWSGTHVFRDTLIGTGLTDAPAYGTWMAQLGLSGVPALWISRFGPLLTSLGLVVWLYRRRPLSPQTYRILRSGIQSAARVRRKHLGLLRARALVCWTLTGVLRGRLSASVVVWAALLVLSTGLDSGELILPGRLDVQERPWWFQLVLLPLALVISVNDLRRSGQPPEFEWCR